MLQVLRIHCVRHLLGPAGMSSKLKSALILVAVLIPTLGMAAYDPVEHRNSQLKSVFNCREASIFVHVDSRFFDPLKPGESVETKLRSGPLNGGDEIDRSLGYEGQVPKKVETLLSSLLDKNLSIRTVDWKVAPYKFNVTVRVSQLLDLYGKNMFEVSLLIELKESATTRSGFKGFADVGRFEGQTFADSKSGVEGMIYSSLDKAFKSLLTEVEIAKKHCINDICSVAN